MAEQRRYLRGLGAFVVVSAVLLAVLVIAFGHSPMTLFATYHEYSLVFENAPGIAPGTPVRRSGIKIGEVTRVELKPETGEVVVTIRVEPKYDPRSNEEPRIETNLLNGNSAIDFVPKQPAKPSAPPTAPVPATIPPARGGGEEEQQPPPAPKVMPPAKPDLGQPLPPGTTIRAPRQTTPRDFIGQAQELLPSTQQSLDAIRRSVQRYEQLAPVLEDAIREVAEVARSAREIVPEVRRTNDSINSLVQSARAMVPELRQTNEEARAAFRGYAQAGQRLDDLLGKNQDRINRIVTNLDESLVRLNRVLSDDNQRNLSATLASIRRSSASFDDLMKDTRKAVNKFTDTLTQADPAIQDVRRGAKQFADSATQLQAVLTDARSVSAALAARGPAIIKNVDESTAQLNKLLMQFQALAGGAAGANGTIPKLLTDPELYNRVSDLFLMLTRIMPRVDRALQDVETFADKIARHPEVLGVGGAVRPSEGLKGSPFAPYQPSTALPPGWPPP